MSDNVTVTTSEDVIAVVDPTTMVPVTITEESVVVGSGVGQINISQIDDVVSVADSDTVVSITEVEEVIDLKVSDVTVQIIEDSSVPYAKRTDFVGEDKIYKGRAVPGSLDSDPVWQMWLITVTDVDEGDSNDTWADGNSSFDNVWNDHLTLDYS